MKQESNKIIYAGFFTRFLATFVDIFIISIISSVVAYAINIKSIVVLIVIWWLYNTIMLIKYKATIGGRFFGIEVLNKDGATLSFKSASYRFFLSVAPFVLYTLIREMQHDMSLVSSPTIQQLPQLLFFLPPFLMFFTQKKQMIHDLLVHSIVVDKSEIEYVEKKHVEKEEKKSVMYVGQKILRILGTLIFLIIAGYLLIYVGIFYTLAQRSNNSYNASFKQHYAVNDYNDSRIIFYNQELETNTHKQIEAKGMYEIFEADVKNDLALNCIEYFLAREHNVSDWIAMGSGFRQNARNKYTNTEAMLEKFKKNEDHMGKHFYYYDLNEVNHITDDIADKWGKDANKDTCQKMLPVEQMYAMFVMKYIENREDALQRYKDDYKYADTSGMLNKSFYKKEIEKTSTWLEILYKKHPEYSKYLQKQKELARKKELLKAEIRNQREKQKILKMQKNIWQDMKNRTYFTSNELKMLNFNIKNSKGQTPLMIAVKNTNGHIVESLNMVDVNFWAKDKKGKTVFDYIQKPTTKREKIFTDSMYVSLRMLEAYQIVLGKARIITSSYENDSLEIFIQGAKCQEFNFPKNTQCTSK